MNIMQSISPLVEKAVLKGTCMTVFICNIS